MEVDIPSEIESEEENQQIEETDESGNQAESKAHQNLLAGVVAQDDLERDLMQKVDEALAKKDEERDQQLLTKAQQQIG